MVITVHELRAYWVLDSRGNPTVQAELTLSKEGVLYTGVAAVPSGASTGSHEAVELRDDAYAFGGKGVQKAVDNINTHIHQRLMNHQFFSADQIDNELLDLDKSANKSILGANAILAVSIASHKAFAKTQAMEYWQYLRQIYFKEQLDLEFPKLMCNIINGGVHADSGLSIQEFMIVPDMDNLLYDIEAASEIYQQLKKNLARDNQVTAVGDEGGFAPKLEDTKAAIETIEAAIRQTNYKNRVKIALDSAANELYDPTTKQYTLNSKTYNSRELVNYYDSLVHKHPIISIEDGAAEDDLETWSKLTEGLSKSTMLVGDDLFVTNTKRFNELAIQKGLANAVLIKPNQIGTIKETCELINLAKQNNYKIIVSHRSGEVNDGFISDLAFACQANYIKLGAPARGERIAKYNRLIAIYHNLIYTTKHNLQRPLV